jgi:Carbohydrate esterase, sialic acid-specific acetylesterase
VLAPGGLVQTKADRTHLFTAAPLPDLEQSELYVPWGDVHGHLSKGRLVHGPEVGFGRALSAAGWNKVAMIKVYGNFRSDAEVWPWGEGHVFYEKWTAFVDARIDELRKSGNQVKVSGFVWHQGIDDAIHGRLAEEYRENLTKLIQALRNRYAQPNTPFVLARSVNSPLIPPTDNPANSPMGRVRSAQVALAESMLGVGWIDSDDLPKVNRHHFSSQSQLILGQRFGESFLKLHNLPGLTR